MLYRQYALQAPDPALSTRWYMIVPDVKSATMCVAENATLTFQKIPAKQRYRQGKMMNYADTSSVDGINISFYETNDYQVSRWLQAWRLQVFNPRTGVYGMPSRYKKTIEAHLLGIDSLEPKLSLIFTGCFPTDQNTWEVQYDDATGRLKVEAQFSVDDVDPI